MIIAMAMLSVTKIITNTNGKKNSGACIRDVNVVPMYMLVIVFVR